MFHFLFATQWILSTIPGLGMGDGRDLSCHVIQEKKIWEYQFDTQDVCKVCSYTLLVLTDELAIKVPKNNEWLLHN